MQNERGKLRNHLSNLVNDNKIIKQGKTYTIKNNLLEGVVHQNEQDDYYINFNNENYSDKKIKIKNKTDKLKLYKDKKVKFKFTKDKKSKEPLAKIQLNNVGDIFKIVGNFTKTRYFGTVVPDSKAIEKEIYVPYDAFNGAKDGDKVICEIVNFSKAKNYDNEFEGRIIKVLGESGKFETEIESIYYKYNLAKCFPEVVINETNYIDELSDIAERLDYRKNICFTIDPEDAKDFDDAISIVKDTRGNYILGIHIADVSKYVKENSEIDREALIRGTSVYLVNKVIPMLPEKLSNEICSLQENRDKLTFSVLIHLTKNFNIQNYEIKETIINSKKRFDYSEVQKILDSKKGIYFEELSLLYKISEYFLKKRLSEGSLDFESSELSIKLDDNNEINDIKVKKRLNSMRMIEEFMLLANKCVTEYVHEIEDALKLKLPFIYRIHDKPDKDKLKNLSDYIKQFGYTIDLENKKTLKRLLESIKGKQEDFIINDLLIRAMSKAKYDYKNIGHYGLGFVDYTHFTSPIRRYPDLVVHRLIKKYSKLRISNKQNLSDIKNKIPEICKITTEQEQNAVSAEREFIKILQIQYLKKFIGNDFEGIISGIMSYGMFIELIDVLAEGMIRFRDMEDDYYRYDEKKFCATGRKKGKTFRAGQKVKVKIANISLETRKIDLIII